MLTGEARDHINALWPQHAAHLSPPGNKLGSGLVDPEEGVVCNCGEILGFPRVQDEGEYLAQQADEPDTSGAQTGEPEHDREQTQGQEATPDEAGWNDLQAGTADHSYPRDGDPPATGETVLTHGEDWLCRFDDRPVSEHPIQRPGFYHCLTPEPDPAGSGADEAHAIYVPREVAEGGYVPPGFDPNMALPSLPTPDLPARGPVEYTPPREVTSVPPDAQYQVGDKVTVGGIEFTKHSKLPDPDDPASWIREPAQAPEPGPPPAVIPERDHGVVQAEDPLTARVVTIDPTLPYGPMDVEHQLLDINARLERGVHYQRYWEERGFSAKAGYELAWARAIVDSSGGAADVRKAQALIRCEREYLELQLCETMIKAVRETMHNLRSLQSGYQTVANSVRDSMRVPNSRP